MAVMKKLAIGGVTYDTVGEASVTQVQTTGTKIATVTIDGSGTDIYAPAVSSVDPATATPLMDGTGAVGTATKYAREDHVHPSDTSRQATLVSGTNIKTVNNNSLLGSGNITIDAGTALTNAEVDAAVDAAYPVQSYDITDISGSAIVSISTDGTYGSGVGFATEAGEGDTVTIGLPSLWKPIITNVSSGETVSYQYIGYIGITHGWEFTMPDSDVTADAFFDD